MQRVPHRLQVPGSSGAAECNETARRAGQTRRAAQRQGIEALRAILRLPSHGRAARLGLSDDEYGDDECYSKGTPSVAAALASAASAAGTPLALVFGTGCTVVARLRKDLYFTHRAIIMGGRMLNAEEHRAAIEVFLKRPPGFASPQLSPPALLLAESLAEAELHASREEMEAVDRQPAVGDLVFLSVEWDAGYETRQHGRVAVVTRRRHVRDTSLM